MATISRRATAPGRATTGLGPLSFDIAAAGQRLVYVTYSARANIWSLPVPSGRVEDVSRATPLTSGSQVVGALRVSPDRKWLLYDSTPALNADIFRIGFEGGTAERLTTDAGRWRATDAARRIL